VVVAAPNKKARREKTGTAIHVKLRDLRKPASPDARLAGFLNSIFAGKHHRGRALRDVAFLLARGSGVHVLHSVLLVHQSLSPMLWPPRIGRWRS
jgi:hypothetical protein